MRSLIVALAAASALILASTTFTLTSSGGTNNDGHIKMYTDETLTRSSRTDEYAELTEDHPVAVDDEPTTAEWSELNSTWTEDVLQQAVPLAEYPRPQLVRNGVHQILNGLWKYAVVGSADSLPSTWDGLIRVPFALEARLSAQDVDGRGTLRALRLLKAHEALWYQREIDVVPEQLAAGRQLLVHFEAVDYDALVQMNGVTVGHHRGGYAPFSIDASAAVRIGRNNLSVRVTDATRGLQLRGKQRPVARDIWYSRVSGIWRTVWLESVPRLYVTRVVVATPAPTAPRVRSRRHARARVHLCVHTVGTTGAAGADELLTVHVVAMDGSRSVAVAEAPLNTSTSGGARTTRLVLHWKRAKLWTPAAPHLYQLKISVHDAAQRSSGVMDAVESYVGVRWVGKSVDEHGHQKFTLNGRQLFQLGVLDQGWWPDGLLTPPTEMALASEIRYLRDAGFNVIRKHIKVESRRFYHLCDKMGMLVWQDQVSGFRLGEEHASASSASALPLSSPAWAKQIDLPTPLDGIWPRSAHAQFLGELEEMVSALESHPCLVMWILYNEGWGQHDTRTTAKWLLRREPSRLHNVASGGNFHPLGDVADQHSYPDPTFPSEGFDKFVKVVGEFGGHGMRIAGHVWAPEGAHFSYDQLAADAGQLAERYRTSLLALASLRDSVGVAGGIYTQVSDVETELNGLLTYDRRHRKLEASMLARIHRDVLGCNHSTRRQHPGLFCR